MFTGIIEEIGTVQAFIKGADNAKIVINANEILNGTKIGDSISINGVCETVVEIGKNYFTAMISKETLNVTTMDAVTEGSAVNLERALTLQSRLGGHIVSGHIDCIGEIISIEKLSDFYNIEFKIPEDFCKYVVYKGSIAVNGISLTVADILNDKVKVAVIPYTYQNTNLKQLFAGAQVNIETDIFARYIEKMLLLNDNKHDNRIDMNFLKENGFV